MTIRSDIAWASRFTRIKYSLCTTATGRKFRRAKDHDNYYRVPWFFWPLIVPVVIYGLCFWSFSLWAHRNPHPRGVWHYWHQTLVWAKRDLVIWWHTYLPPWGRLYSIGRYGHTRAEQFVYRDDPVHDHWPESRIMMLAIDESIGFTGAMFMFHMNRGFERDDLQ